MHFYLSVYGANSSLASLLQKSALMRPYQREAKVDCVFILCGLSVCGAYAFLTSLRYEGFWLPHICQLLVSQFLQGALAEQAPQLYVLTNLECRHGLFMP